MNGYQMIRSIAERTGGVWRPSPGAIYPALAQLEDEGLIEQADGGGKVYRLTDAGRAEVDAAADRPRPWESATREAEDGLGGTADLWMALGQLALATRAVGQAGDRYVTQAAVELLTESRRGLYRLLAQDSVSDDLDGDDDEADDIQDVLTADARGRADAPDDEPVEGEVVDDGDDSR